MTEQPTPLQQPTDIVDEILAALDADSRIAELSRDLAAEISGRQICAGRSPRVMAAACVYLASAVRCPGRGYEGLSKYTQEEVAQAGGCSKSAIRSRYQEVAELADKEGVVEQNLQDIYND